jgi:hypothetical protein
LNHEFNIASLNCMVECLFRQVTSQIPASGAAMEVGDFLRMVMFKLFIQEIGEESVITEPLSPIVQWNEE